MWDKGDKINYQKTGQSPIGLLSRCVRMKEVVSFVIGCARRLSKGRKGNLDFDTSVIVRTPVLSVDANK